MESVESTQTNSQQNINSQEFTGGTSSGSSDQLLSFLEAGLVKVGRVYNGNGLLLYTSNSALRVYNDLSCDIDMGTDCVLNLHGNGSNNLSQNKTLSQLSDGKLVSIGSDTHGDPLLKYINYSDGTLNESLSGGSEGLAFPVPQPNKTPGQIFAMPTDSKHVF